DGRGAGCDLGPDCDDGDAGIWSGCAGCTDSDGDGHDGHDATACPGGDDRCDADPDNWTASGCASCVDADGDGFGRSCDRGPDCADDHAGAWEDCSRPPNGGFESGLGSWTGATGSVSVSPDANNGASACLLQGGASGASLNSPPFLAYEGRRYRLHAQVRQTAGSGRYKVTVAWLDAGGGVLRYDNDWAGDDRPAAYSFHGGEFLAPEATRQAVVMLGVQPGTDCLFDDIGLELRDEPYEIWVTPDFRYDNNALFAPGAAWEGAAAATRVFKLHERELNDNDQERDWILDVGQMVAFLDAHGMQLGLETAGTRGGDACTNPNGTGIASANGLIGLVDRVVDAGGRVDLIMMDGPVSRIIDGGRQVGDGGAAGECGFSLQESAEQVVAYMQAVHAAYPQIRIGLGINFDHWRFQGLECFFGTDVANYSRGSGYDYNQVLDVLLPAIARAGERLDFVILDNPYEPYYKATHAPESFGGAALDQNARLRSIQAYCAVRGIDMGFMYNTADGSSDANFYAETLAQLREHESNGVQYRIINPESWYDGMPAGYLPDSTAYTFMNLVLGMAAELAAERDLR
ncbi:MAG: hypothetical protein JXR96_24815, partial [Deltaproteobacteria bacterium]|nr:hypothetical protein [Deltaproteobacteria bacterium]